jgi:hypothetical protein
MKNGSGALRAYLLTPSAGSTLLRFNFEKLGKKFWFVNDLY